jgi:BON domain
MANLRKPIDRAGGLARTGSRRVGRLGRRTGSFVVGKGKALVNRSRPKTGMDDHTLENKVQTEIFRGRDAPKGSVSVNVVAGVVELRGEVKRPEIKKALEDDVRAIPEVRDVRNLLHLPKTPAPGRADSPGRQRRATR